MAIYTVSGASNDARMKVTTGAMNISSTSGNSATQLDGTNSAGYRFTAVSLVQGAGISKATLTLNLINIGGSGPINHTKVYGDNADNSTTFTTTSGNLDRKRTNASYPLGSVPSSPSTFTIDVTKIVQEIVDRKGWISGNALSILLVGSGTAGSAIIDAWRQNMYPATLEIIEANGTTPAFPSIASNDLQESYQIPWNNLQNLGANDGSLSTSSWPQGGSVSAVLKTSGYGFALPQSAKINGIQVKVRKQGSNAADGLVQLLKGGNYAGYLYGKEVTWATTAQTITYGGVDDLWGENWTYADINDPSFGFAFQAYNTHGGGSASIDSVTITVFYNDENLKAYKVEQSYHPVDPNISPTANDYIVFSSGNQAYGDTKITHVITNYQGKEIELSRIRYHFSAVSGTFGGDPKTGTGGTYYDRTGIPITVKFYSSLSNANANTNVLATRYGTLKSNIKESYDYYLDSPIVIPNGSTLAVVIEATTVSGVSEPGTIFHYGSDWYNNDDVDDDPNQVTYRFQQGSGSSPTDNSLFYELYSIFDIPDESAFPEGGSEMIVNGYKVQFGDALIRGNSEMTVEGYAVGFGSATAVGDSKMYADRITAVGGSNMIVDGTINPLAITKTYQYKVYDKDWNFLGTWDDVVSNFGYSQEINSAGAAISVTLARNSDTGIAAYDVLADDDGTPIVTDGGITLAAETDTLNAIGPGTTVDLNLNVKIYEFSSNTLDVAGDLVFTGYISMYTSQYGSTENTVVSVFSYGADLDNYVLMDGNNTRVPYLSQDPSEILAQSLDKFNLDGGIISYFKDDNPLTDNTIEDTETIVTYTFNANTMFEVVKKCLELAPTDWFFYPDLATNLLYFKPRPTTPDHYFYLGKHVLSLSLEKTMEGITNDVFFTGGKPTYSVVDRFNALPGTLLQNHLPEKGGAWMKHPSSASAHSVATTDGNRIRGNGTGEGVYLNMQAIPSSNYTVEADFHVKTVAGNQSIIGRADPSALTYYMGRIDTSSNKAQLYKCISGTHTVLQEYTLPAGKTLAPGQTRKLQLKMDGSQITLLVDNESLVDVVDRSIVTGSYGGVRMTTTESNSTGIHLDNFQVGMINTDNQVQIYKRYVDNESIDTYRRGVERVTDNRVTVEDSADVIVASMINRAKDPRYRSNISISGSTYNIRSIKLGDLVGFRNFGNYVDEVTMQVVRIDYTPDAVQLQLDTLLPSVPKRLEDIKRNLNQEQVSDNPDAPDV